MKKTFYYRFNKIDICLILLLAESFFICLMGLNHPILWLTLLLTTIVWGYKNIIKHAGVIITDENIKIDYSKPISWKDLKQAEIKTIRLCGKDKKILSLVPKKNISYKYSYLQKNNCDFGPFPIPLYGLFSASDEKEIIELVSKKLKIK